MIFMRLDFVGLDVNNKVCNDYGSIGYNYIFDSTKKYNYIFGKIIMLIE